MSAQQLSRQSGAQRRADKVALQKLLRRQEDA